MPVLDRRVRAPDGTSIAFSVEGRGAPIMLTNGLTTTTFFWKYVRPLLLRRHQVIAWDYAGHGASEPARTPESASIAGQPGIVARVLDAAGVSRAAHVGWSVGCQVVLEIYRQLPERCAALALLFGPAEHALSHTELPLPAPALKALLHHPLGAGFAAAFQQATWLTMGAFGPAFLRRSGLIGPRTSDRDVRQLLTSFRAVDPVTLQRMACSAEAHSARDVLHRLDRPLLVIAGDRDPFAPLARVGGPIHAAVPSSELVRLPSATHTALLEYPDEIAYAIHDFLERRATGAGPSVRA